MSGKRRAHNQPIPPRGSDTGALVLVVIAVAAFCGWYTHYTVFGPDGRDGAKQGD